MKLNIHHIFSEAKGVIGIQWSIEDPVPTKVAGVTFSVDVSGATEGPWTTLASGVDNVVYEHVLVSARENTQNNFSRSTERWYRVRAALADGTELISDLRDNANKPETLAENVHSVGIVPQAHETTPHAPGVFTQAPAFRNRLHLIQRAVQRRALINLQIFTGIEVAVLKKRHFGARCTACYDTFSKTVIKTRCGTCYGTGYTQGYWAPVVTQARVSEDPERTLETPVDTAHVHMSRIELANYPRLEHGDVVVELHNNKRWLIQQEIMFRALKRMQVTQHWSAVELSISSVVYDVAVHGTNLR